MRAFLLGAALAVVAGCSGGEAALPDELVCTAQYRPFAESMEGAEEQTFTVERIDRPTTSGIEVEFSLMTIEVHYTGDAPDGRNVRVTVTDRDGAEITTALYQIGRPGLQDIGFAGGHGFTGLHYVYHEQAMLQFFCGAGEPG